MGERIINPRKNHFKKYYQYNDVMINPYIFAPITKTIKYGYLYNWYVTQGTGNASITSSDTWKVPTYTQIDDLITYIGGSSVAGGKLKTTILEYCNNSLAGTDDYNFKLNCNSRDSDGIFSKQYTYITTTTEANPSLQKVMIVVSANNGLYPISYTSKENGCVIRLVRSYVEGELNKAGQVTTNTNNSNDGNYMADYIGNDGQSYPTVKIGTQVWLAVNLAETKLRDGSLIPNVTDNSAWAALTTGARCAYNNLESNVFN